MIESKLKVKNCKLGTAVSTWLGLISRVYAAQNRTTSVKTVVYKVLAGNDDPSGLKFESPPIDNSRVTIVVSIRKVRIDRTILTLKAWTKPCENNTANIDKTIWKQWKCTAYRIYWVIVKYKSRGCCQWAGFPDLSPFGSSLPASTF